MEDNIKKAIKKGEEIALKYNPNTLIPFPFEKILKDECNLKIEINDSLKEINDSISGVLFLKKDKDNKETFYILINEAKHKNRIYFTIAHELGHYFLHKDELRKNMIVDDDETQKLFRIDGSLSDEKEREANHFAASLIMPKNEVEKTWNTLKDVDECAEIFSVSKDAMSIRLANLKLID
ncbi:MAG: ImmA/IrrE family metallo-endopeptidase [Candidatus Pacebacteria bacterium]|nr:ImmA/IrrE family metallo-endopeptidase [Candidatus Paceibacterota bacterium]